MSGTLELVVVLLIGLIGYHYAGYPLLVHALARAFPRPPRRGDVTPSVAVVVAAHDEGAIIAEKIEATLALDYPDVEIIVSSDGSTDDTVAVAARYADRGVRVIAAPTRAGKGAALNRAVAQSSAEIVVISDANAFPAPDALRQLVRSFHDPEVGCVSGRVAPGPLTGAAATSVAESEGAYWRYEGFIKAAESTLASATGVVGSLLAVRRDCYEPVPPAVINDDSHLMLAVMRRGLRAVYEPKARCWRRPSRTAADEITRRKRLTAGRYQHLARLRSWPWNAPLTVFMLVSHKYLRLLMPLAMALALVLNLLVVGRGDASTWLQLTLAGQAAFYAAAGAGFVLAGLGRRLRPAAIAYFLVAGNLAMAWGFVNYVAGRQTVLWTRVSR